MNSYLSVANAGRRDTAAPPDGRRLHELGMDFSKGGVLPMQALSMRG